jgi:hypothetical protein
MPGPSQSPTFHYPSNSMRSILVMFVPRNITTKDRRVHGTLWADCLGYELRDEDTHVCQQSGIKLITNGTLDARGLFRETGCWMSISSYRPLLPRTTDWAEQKKEIIGVQTPLLTECAKWKKKHNFRCKEHSVNGFYVQIEYECNIKHRFRVGDGK